jgi:hypothetical protein
METAAASIETTESAACHAKGCGESATAPCDRCGQPFCQTHLSQLVLRRRTERSEHLASRDMLARLPTRSESYMLCSQCRSKPVLR